MPAGESVLFYGMTSRKPPWEKAKPRKTRKTTLSAAKKETAKRRAKRAGRRYPNLVDNMRAAKEQKAQRAKP
jgi:hypothetical protein